MQMLGRRLDNAAQVQSGMAFVMWHEAREALL